MVNTVRHIIKHQMVRRHREERYGHWLDRLINGTARPGDVTLRWNKLKAVR